MTNIKTLLLTIFLSTLIFPQYNLNYFINQAFDNSPQIKNYSSLFLINDLQKRLNEAENSAFQISITGNYLFAPYFNNNGHLISTNPDPKAIGYDIGITNGGEYSALLNVDKNIFNGPLLDALENQRAIQGKNYRNQLNAEKHNLKKRVTEQYLNALENLKLYNLSKEAEGNFEDQLKLTEALVEKGIIKVHDYMLLKLEAQSQQIDLNQTWMEYQNSIFQLYSTCGIEDSQVVLIDSLYLTQSVPPDSSEFLRQFYLDSLNTISRQNVFETKYLPQIKLFFNTGLNAVEIENIQRRFGLSAGINLSMPIFDGGQKNITRQQSFIEQKINSELREADSRNIIVQRRDSGNRLNFFKKNIDDFKNQLQEFNKLLLISSDEMQRGNLSMIDYLNEYRSFIDLQKKLISAEIKYQLEINNYNYWSW